VLIVRENSDEMMLEELHQEWGLGVSWEEVTK
jgi:hypothetical protein